MVGAIRPGTIGYVYALALVAAAAFVRAQLELIRPGFLPFETFYPAVLLATLWGGPGPGAFAVACSGILGGWAFLPPTWSVEIDDWMSFGLFIGSAALLVWIAAAYRREQGTRSLLMREMQHRTKNTSAVVQAIVSQSLKDSPGVATSLNGRLRALFATNDLLTQSRDQKLSLRAIIESELKPYGPERAMLSGPNLLLEASLARTVALVIHELATNAAKYGALSEPDGYLIVTWQHETGVASLTWEECGGPQVTIPTQLGFGTKLMETLLRPYDGTIESAFRPTGVVCCIRFGLELGRRASAAPAPN